VGQSFVDDGNHDDDDDDDVVDIQQVDAVNSAALQLELGARRKGKKGQGKGKQDQRDIEHETDSDQAEYDRKAEALLDRQLDKLRSSLLKNPLNVAESKDDPPPQPRSLKGDEKNHQELLQSQQQQQQQQERQKGEEVKVDGKPPRPPASATTTVTAAIAPTASGGLADYINSKTQRLSLTQVQDQAQVLVKETTIAMDPNFATADWDEDHTPLPTAQRPPKLASASAPQGPGITPDSNWLEEDFDK
jgi:hypothetical protein